jgi:hypothetical protein
MRLSARARRARRRARLFVFVLTPDWGEDPHVHAMVAYACQLGKPFRVLVRPGVRMPEDLFVDIADLQIAASRGVEQDTAQVQAWFAELAP